MTDLNSFDGLTSALQSYVVAPLNAFGAGGFLFDVPTDQTANLDADITDHYAEDNQALQDHIARKPKYVTLRGFVGELVYSVPNGDGGFLQTVTQKLTTISQFLPQLSAGATQLTDGTPPLSNSTLTLSGASNIYALVKNTLSSVGSSSKQQAAFQYFAACWNQGILMGIQTPWEFLTNMAIKSIVAIQDGDSTFMTDFAITFKQIRIAATTTALTPLTGTGGAPSPGGTFSQAVASLQGEAPTNNGIVPGLGLPYSGLPGAQASIVSTASLANNSLGRIFTYTPAGN